MEGDESCGPPASLPRPRDHVRAPHAQQRAGIGRVLDHERPSYQRDKEVHSGLFRTHDDATYVKPDDGIAHRSTVVMPYYQ